MKKIVLTKLNRHIAGVAMVEKAMEHGRKVLNMTK